MEDVKGIPDVAGLEAFVQSSAEQPLVKETPEAPRAEEKVDLGQFKKPEDLLKSYKEIQGYTTKVAQENKALQEKLAAYEQQMQLIQMQQYQQAPQAPPPQQDFDTQFINNPKQAIDNVVNQRVNETIRTMTIQDVLQEESAKNPQEFRERYQYAMAARQMYPNLVNSSQGVRMLFQVADKMRTEDLKRNAEKSVKMLFGEDVDFQKFRELVKKDGQPDNKQGMDLAYMPDSTGAFRTGTDTGQVNFAKSIDDAVGKGDVDTVLDAIFRQKGVRR
jgi:hypothetical protein